METPLNIGKGPSHTYSPIQNNNNANKFYNKSLNTIPNLEDSQKIDSTNNLSFGPATFNRKKRTFPIRQGLKYSIQRKNNYSLIGKYPKNYFNLRPLNKSLDRYSEIPSKLGAPLEIKDQENVPTLPFQENYNGSTSANKYPYQKNNYFNNPQVISTKVESEFGTKPRENLFRKNPIISERMYNYNGETILKRLELADRMNAILSERLKELDKPDNPYNKDDPLGNLKRENENVYLNIIKLQEERIINLESQVNNQYQNSEKETYINFLEKRIKELNGELRHYYKKIADLQNEKMNSFEAMKVFGRGNAIKHFEACLKMLKAVLENESSYFSEIVSRNEAKQNEVLSLSKELNEKQANLDNMIENMKQEIGKKNTTEKNIETNIKKLVEIDEDLRKDIFRLIVILNESKVDSEEIRQLENKYFMNSDKNLLK